METKKMNREVGVERKVLFELQKVEVAFFDKLAEKFERELRPSDIEITEEFRALIRGLERRGLIENVKPNLKPGEVPSYQLTAIGQETVRLLKKACK